MWSFGSPDSKLMQMMEMFAEIVWLTILMLVTSLPLVTIGAALSAGHEVARRVLNSEGHMTKRYFRSFANNFWQSFVIWLVLGPLLVLIVWSWIAVRLTPLMIVQFALSIVWVIVAEWVFALQARFSNSVMRTLYNAMIFGITYWQATLALVLVDAAFIALVYASVVYFLQGLPLLLLLGWGSLMMLHTPIVERVFAKYIAVSK